MSLQTAGKVAEGTILRLPVPEGRTQAAVDGLDTIAFLTDGEWQSYPTTYDPSTKMLTATVTHFSIWGAFEWDWTSALAQVSQNVLQGVGIRSDKTPSCDTAALPTPSWVNAGAIAGVSGDPGLVVRGCLRGHPGDDVLDVQLVNNRPYGLILHYGSAVTWGWHEDAEDAAELLRNAIGDMGAQLAGGLYLPPLSQASVGIANPHLPFGTLKFTVSPTWWTVTADLAATFVGPMFGKLALTANVAAKLHSIQAVTALKRCGEAAAVASVSSEASVSTNLKNLSGLVSLKEAGECLQAVLIVYGRQLISDGLIATSQFVRVDKAISALKVAGRAAALVKAGLGLAVLGDALVDATNAAVPGLGFGFSILLRSTAAASPETTPSTPPSVESPAPATSSLLNLGVAQPQLAVTGACTNSSGVLHSTSSGFSAGGRYTVQVDAPGGGEYRGSFSATGTVAGNGSILWQWDCTGDSPGIYHTQVTDETSGRTTGWVPFTISEAQVSGPAPTDAPPTGTVVTVWSNLGEPDEPGHYVCRGNPGRPESMPGGSVAQTITVGAGVSSLTSATFNVDIATEVTVELTVKVNGTAVGPPVTTTAAGEGTRFDFGPVPVQAGDQVTFAMVMSATAGKLDVVYTRANPSGRLQVVNYCSDGAASFDVTSKALIGSVLGVS